MKFLNFQIDSLDYGVPLEQVREVIAFPDFTTIPGTSNYCLGIMSLRDKIIPLLDLRIKFQIEPTLTHDTSVIVCQVADTNIGVIVDSIQTVIDMGDQDVLGLPTGIASSTKNTDLVANVVQRDSGLVLILNMASVVGQSEIDLKKLNEARSTSPKAA